LLLTVATHPEALGGSAAFLLRRDPATALWVLGMQHHRPDEVASLEDTLRHFHRPATPPASPATAWDIEALDSICQEAWKVRAARLGSAAGDLPWTRGSAVAAIPLVSSVADHGLLVVEFGGESESRAGRLDAFDRIVQVTLELAQRGHDGARRADHLGALVEVSRQSLVPRNIAELLHAVARLAAHHTDADGAAVWTTQTDGSLRLDVTYGPSDTRERFGRALHPVAVAALESERPRVSVPGTDEFLLPTAAAAELASCAVWPAVAYGRGLGAIGVWSAHGNEPPAVLGRAERDYLAALSHLAALALDHARRFSELRDAERREREAAQYARQRERLAVVGELVARGNQEALKPLVSIRAFAKRLERTLAEDDPAREYAEVIVREAERLERLLTEQQALAQAPPATLERVGLNLLIDRALQACGDPLVARRARVLKKLATDLPALLLDRSGVQHVIETMVRFALDSIAVGGRIRLESRRLPGHVLFELGHDGAHLPGEALEQLFLPFGGGRLSSIGAGLSVAQRVIQEHGGELRVRSDGEWTTVMCFTLPVIGNQDRRRPGADRRARHPDRRRASV
jgi:signal transduction histidine kinase